jgi:ParB/RepB/Spo0J family partition protein
MDALPIGEMKELEIALLDLRYAHTRVMQQDQLLSLAVSLEACGQVRPVITAAHYVLVDGYRRVEALKICGRETVMAQVWECGEDQALLRLLCVRRRWDAVEEAAIIRELIHAHGLTQVQVARRLCKDPSWVDRRLSLLDSLPDDVLDSVKSGRVSSWAASRVLAPLARANADHAAAINGWMKREQVSTRDLATFFEHYKKSGQGVRERMVGAPSLFMKTLGAQRREKEAREIREGPEGKWISELGSAARILKRLARSWETVLHCDRGSAILATLDDMDALVGDLRQRIRSSADDHTGDDRGCSGSERKGNEDPPDQRDPEDIEKHGQTGPAGGGSNAVPAGSDRRPRRASP